MGLGTNPVTAGHSVRVLKLFIGPIGTELSCFLLLQKVPTSNTEGGWSYSLAEFIRHNDMPIHEAADKALKTFQEEFMPVETFSEFLDVAGKHSLCFPFYRLPHATRDSRRQHSRHSNGLFAGREETLAPSCGLSYFPNTLEHPQTGKFLSPDPMHPPSALLNNRHDSIRVFGDI